METMLSEEMIRDDLIKTFQRLFDLNVLEYTPIKRGLLNLKWKVTTDSGQFLLKQYNKKRYKLYNPEELLLAFSQQVRLFDQGLACPNLLSHNESILFASDNGERFTVMEYCQGKLNPPGKTNIHQIYDLGRATGKMHRLLNDGTLSINKSPQFVPPRREERLAHWNSVWEQTKDAGKTRLLADIETQRRATEDFNIEILELLQLGWAHRDLWVDNLLFNDNRLTAILDFDRLKYDYPQLDVARAVISCALDDNLDVSLASAFMDGYSEERTVVKGYLTNSLKLLWYMESTWWINASMDQHSVPPARFAKEMIWLAENQKNLSALLGNI
ncbi:phosphotransferase [Paenibacillus radicis (ex Xue et al. 2023)]|uniref:Phosphotransferase n=1 Tax=Paenibacillus radicis (ex Xue et al. 2023) TaxID=2972489 RepID=A0ABT1YHH9_9BACL|nr:phosphotransferase [Paenibacillus radicis (ex Xue et al. 2023)]MCR8632180.1 phosphotransferase [Paenibacillus radicis (ex Xue et al. 2023)]